MKTPLWARAVYLTAAALLAIPSLVCSLIFDEQDDQPPTHLGPAVFIFFYNRFDLATQAA